MSDSDFVISAYQSSQIMGIGTNGSAWADVLGADRLRQIEDPELRNDLATLLSSDYAIIDTPAVDTPYRRNVRRLIPIALQDAVREQCGDQPPSAPAFFPFAAGALPIETADNPSCSSSGE